MGKYFLTAKALSDLSDIYEYTYYFWSENHADKYYQNLIDCFQSLAKSPRIGRAYDEIDLGLLGFPMRKHVIFYKLYAEEEIEIIRILSSNMDLKKLIKE